MKVYVLLFGFIFSLALMAGIFAQSSGVSLSISPEELSVDPYDIAIYDIIVENIGLEDEIYVISVEGIPEDWYSLSHESVDVSSSETKIIYLFITPRPTDQDVYIGEVSVDNISTEFKLNIIKDHEIQVSIPSQLVSCFCEDSQATILVENTGKYSENLDLILGGNALDIITVEIESFTLEPNETKQIPVMIDPLCDANEGVYNLEVEVKSTNSYASSSALSNIRKMGCFNFEIDYPQEVRECGSIDATFKITVANTGIKEDSYEVNIEELGYSDIIQLEPGQTQEFEITFMKEEEGSYEIPFFVSSDSKRQEGLVNFIAEKCFAVDIELDTNEITIKSGTGKLTKPIVKNIGTRSSTYNVEASATWVAVKPDKLTLSPNESENIFVYYSPEYGSSGEFDVRLTAKSENANDEEVVRVNVGDEVTTTTIEGTEETTTTLGGETTTTQEFPEPPDIDITTPTGMFGKIWEELENLSENLSEKADGLGINKMVLSLATGFIIALVILVVIYLIVMRD